MCKRQSRCDFRVKVTQVFARNLASACELGVSKLSDFRCVLWFYEVSVTALGKKTGAGYLGSCSSRKTREMCQIMVKKSVSGAASPVTAKECCEIAAA